MLWKGENLIEAAIFNISFGEIVSLFFCDVLRGLGQPILLPDWVDHILASFYLKVSDYRSDSQPYHGLIFDHFSDC